MADRKQILKILRNRKLLVSLIAYLIKKEKAVDLLREILNSEFGDFIDVKKIEIRKETSKNDLFAEVVLKDNRQNTNLYLELYNFKLETIEIEKVGSNQLRFDSFNIEPHWLNEMVKIYLKEEKKHNLPKIPKKILKRIERLLD